LTVGWVFSTFLFSKKGRLFFLYTVAIQQSDGKIVAAGSTNAPVPNDDPGNFAVVRYNPDGSVDTTFGDNSIFPGTTLLDFGDGSTDELRALALQPDGKIVAAGFSDASLGVGNTNFALVRYDLNGVAITDFGTNNRVLTDLENTTGDHVLNSSTDRANAIAIQPDGLIVVAGVFSRSLISCIICSYLL
jgi:hypothetical protein